MRAFADRRLTTPYRSWIDRATPLPDGVRLLPRTADVSGDAISLLFGAMVGGMGVLIAALVPWTRFEPERNGWGAPLFVAALSLALLSVPLLLLRRLVHTWGAASDQRRGTLRQGVFVGEEGMLVRMEPGRCHAIAPDRFVSARLYPPDGSKDRRKRTLILETRDGTIEFFADRLAGHPRDIHAAARERWRGSWKEPGPLLRRDRKTQADRVTPRKMMRATYLFVGAMAAVFTGLGAVLALGSETPAGEWASLLVFLGLVGIAAAVVNLFYRFLTLKLWHRCPECGGKTIRNFEALPDIHFYCRPCNVEWTTGLRELPKQG